MDKDKSASATGIVERRVKRNIKEIQAYSVPHIDCRIKLDGNESPFPLPREIREKLGEALNEVDINRYPDPEARGFREKIARASGIPIDGVLLGNGSDELIGMLVETCTGSTGRVLYPTPTFSMYGLTAKAMGAEVIEVPLDHDFDIDLGTTIDRIENLDPDIIFLASPNNPTGNVYSEDKIKSIIETAAGIVVVDEAYSDFSGYTLMPLLEKNENLVIMRTLSKVGFAGLRLGMLYANPDLVRELNKVRYPYNINSLSQAAAELVLENHEFVSENIQIIVKERDRVFGELKPLQGIELFPSNANFILFRVGEADRVFRELVDRDILIRNFNKPGRLEHCMRVTIGTPEENNAFIEYLGDILSS
jgi:histidinol-phosphate aminotransferase